MAKKIVLGQTNLKDLHEVFDMSEECLESRKARLFPIGNSEQETSTVSIFLASLSAVKEYREELFLSIGVNKIKTRNVNIHVYTEIDGGNEKGRPDGLIVITSGKNTPVIEWIGFVEAKISNNMLDDGQIEKYTDYAREVGISEIITISNYLVTKPTMSPINSKKRSFNFYHWSWAYLKVVASRLIRTDSIEDEDHIYILSELRKYFDSHRNLRHFIDMGADWKDSTSIVEKYEKDQKIKKELLSSLVLPLVQEEKDISLQLTDKTSFLVELLAKEDRISELESMLNDTKVATTKFIINGDKSNVFYIDIDFIRQSVTCYTNISIEKGKAQAQTSTILRMLENEAGVTENIFINAVYTRNKSIEKDTVTLYDLIEEKNKNVTQYSILNKDLGDAVKYFEIKTIDKLGKNFGAKKNFIVYLENIAERFLSQVMVNLLK